MMAAQKVEGRLLVSGEELGGNRSNSHDFGGRKLGLNIVFVSDSFEQIVKESVQGYNLFRHGRLRQEIGVDNLTLPKACTAYTR